MSAADRLDEIQARSDSARQVLTSGTTGTPPHVDGVDVDEGIDILAESTADVPALVAALQAVLDVCGATTIQARPHGGGKPYMIVSADDIRAAIENALGGEA